MTNIFPTSYSDKPTPVGADKVWGFDSVAGDNKNLTVDGIGTTVFSERDTDNLSEGATNKYASTANVDAAGATMNTDTDVSLNGWVIDEDNMASDDATKVPTQQSVKAYVDSFPIPSATTSSEGIIELATQAEADTGTDATRAITPSTLNGVNENQVGTPSTVSLNTDIQATQNGFVYIYAEPTGSGSFTITLVSDSSPTPTTLRGKIISSSGNICFPIQKDQYYKITNDDPVDSTNEIYQFIPLG